MTRVVIFLADDETAGVLAVVLVCALGTDWASRYCSCFATSNVDVDDDDEIMLSR